MTRIQALTRFHEISIAAWRSQRDRVADEAQLAFDFAFGFLAPYLGHVLSAACLQPITASTREAAVFGWTVKTVKEEERKNEGVSKLKRKGFSEE